MPVVKSVKTRIENMVDLFYYWYLEVTVQSVVHERVLRGQLDKGTDLWLLRNTRLLNFEEISPQQEIQGQ